MPTTHNHMHKLYAGASERTAKTLALSHDDGAVATLVYSDCQEVHDGEMR